MREKTRAQEAVRKVLPAVPVLKALPAKDTGCGFPGRYRLFWRSTQGMLHVPHLFIKPQQIIHVSFLRMPYFRGIL